MNDPSDVSIFWDAAAKPVPSLSGFEAVEAIRSATKPLGFVKGFKLYADISGFDSLSHDFRFQVQCSGVTLVDTASSGRLGSATKMIIVDSFIHALDNPSSCILILTNDPDICYGVSLLRLRGYHVFILSPSDAHPSLGQFSMDGSVDNSMLLSERRVQQTIQKPQASGHGRRASLRVPVQGSGNTGGLSEQDVLPTPTIQAFRDQFAANSSLRTSSVAMTRPSMPSRSMTVSPPSRSSSSADQVFQTPKATVETDDEDDEDYITLTPPKQRKEKTPTSNGRSDDTPEPHSGSLSSHSNSSGFSIVPLSQPTRNDTVAGLSGNEKPTSTSPNIPPSIRTQESTSKASANLASPDRPNSSKQDASIPAENSSSAPAVTSEERQDLGLHIPPTIPEVKQPTPRRSTFPSFFPPPPLSPDRTPLVLLLPTSRPATAAPSLETLRAASSNNSKVASPVVPKQPSVSGTLLAQAQQTPKPASAPPSASITNPFASLGTPAVKVVPPVASTPKAPAPSLPAAGPLSVPKPTVPVGPTRAAGATPQPAASSSSTAATSSAPAVAPQFAVLVQHLKVLRTKGQNIVDRSSLGTALPKLQSDVYVKAQVSQFSKPLRKYCEAAEKAGVVIFRGSNSLSLHPAYH